MRHIKHDVQERWWRQERRKQRLSQSSTSPEEKEVSKEVVAAKPPEENEVSAAHSRAGELPRSTTSSCAQAAHTVCSYGAFVRAERGRGWLTHVS